MLVCQNCGEVHAIGTPHCHYCNMPASLVPRPQVGEEPVQEKEIRMTTCSNCGGETSSEESKCTHCSFPLPNNTLGDSQDRPLPLVKLIRKTG